jgi:hypothetical protein
MIDLRSSYSNYQFSAKHKTEVEVQKAEIRSQIRGASFDASGFAAFRAERLCLSGKLQIGFEAMPQFIPRHSLVLSLVFSESHRLSARNAAKPLALMPGP